MTPSIFPVHRSGADELTESLSLSAFLAAAFFFFPESLDELELLELLEELELLELDLLEL